MKFEITKPLLVLYGLLLVEVVFLFSYFFYPSFPSIQGFSDWLRILGGSRFYYAVFLFFSYFIFLVIRNRITERSISLLLISFFYVVIPSLIALVSLWLILYNIDEYSVYTATQWILDIEVSMFGFLPEYHIQNIPAFFERVIVYSYGYLTLIGSLIFIACVILKKDFLLKRFLVSCYFASAVSIPFWFFVPILPPTVYIDHGIANQEVRLEGVDNTYDYSDFLSGKIQKYNEMWISGDSSFYAVSSFPSLHAALGIIFSFYFVILLPSIRLVTYIWLVGNTIGTYYLLQHFLLDTVFGVVVGACVVVLVEFLFREKIVRLQSLKTAKL